MVLLHSVVSCGCNVSGLYFELFSRFYLHFVSVPLFAGLPPFNSFAEFQEIAASFFVPVSEGLNVVIFIEKVFLPLG